MMVASTSVKDQLTVQFSLFKLIVSLNCALSGAHYPERETSLFSCNGVFTSTVIFRYAFSAKITVFRNLLCLFRRLLYRRPFRRRIRFRPHCVIFAFPRTRKMCGVLRIVDLLLSYYFPHKNWNYCLTYCRSNQKILRMHPPWDAADESYSS